MHFRLIFSLRGLAFLFYRLIIKQELVNVFNVTLFQTDVKYNCTKNAIVFYVLRYEQVNSGPLECNIRNFKGRDHDWRHDLLLYRTAGWIKWIEDVIALCLVAMDTMW